MYNSETWAMTKTTADKIDAFHRTLLRQVLDIHYPHIITNIELYRRTRQTKWSKQIRRHRVRLAGHILRLPHTTPVQQAITQAHESAKYPPGQRKTTWISTINSDMHALGIPPLNSDVTRSFARLRERWRILVDRI